jgi:hypothetical protein
MQEKRLLKKLPPSSKQTSESDPKDEEIYEFEFKLRRLKKEHESSDNASYRQQPISRGGSTSNTPRVFNNGKLSR